MRCKWDLNSPQTILFTIYDWHPCLQLAKIFWMKHSNIYKWNSLCMLSRHCVVVSTFSQIHSTKPELRFCVNLNPAFHVSETCNGENLLQKCWQRFFIIIINPSQKTTENTCYVLNITISKNLCLLKLSYKDNGMLAFSFALVFNAAFIQNMYNA